MSIATFLLVLTLPVAGVAGYAIRAYIGRVKLNSAEAKSHRIIQDSIKEAEAKRKSFSSRQKTSF